MSPLRRTDRVVHIAFRLVSIAAVLLAITVAVLIVQSIQKNQALSKASSALHEANKTEGRLLSDEERLCHRLNVHRVEQDDANWYREWRFDRFALGNIRVPVRRVQQPGSKRARRRQTRDVSAAFTYLAGIVDGMTWTPATKSCLAPGGGSTPIRFIVRQPTKADLSLASDQ